MPRKICPRMVGGDVVITKVDRGMGSGLEHKIEKNIDERGEK